MKQYIFIILCGLCIFLTGCPLTLVQGVAPPDTIETSIEESISPTAHILSCLAEVDILTSKQLHEQFIRANESFQISGNDTDRFQLICLSLAWSDYPPTLNLGISLLREYLSSNDSAGEDMQGLYWLLKSFEQRLQEERTALIKERRALKNAEAKTNVLENQLQKLKNIEKILEERSN